MKYKIFNGMDNNFETFFKDLSKGVLDTGQVLYRKKKGWQNVVGAFIYLFRMVLLKPFFHFLE